MSSQNKAARCLAEGCEKMGLDIDSEGQTRLLEYLAQMKKWNRTHNLTAIHSDLEMVTHHLLDSLAIMPYIRGTSLLDIGSGAGLPGIPIAMANPQISLTSLDSRRKRIEFQRFVSAPLRQMNVALVHSRVEDYQPAQKFDTLVARAFASVAHFLGSCEHLLGAGTRVLAMKGRHPGEEIDALPDALRQRCLGEKIEVVEISVPFLMAERHLVILDIVK